MEKLSCPHVHSQTFSTLCVNPVYSCTGRDQAGSVPGAACSQHLFPCEAGAALRFQIKFHRQEADARMTMAHSLPPLFIFRC